MRGRKGTDPFFSVPQDESPLIKPHRPQALLSSTMTHSEYLYSRKHAFNWFLLAALAGSVNTGGFLACERFVSVNGDNPHRPPHVAERGN